MRVVVALETRFSRTPDGRVWSSGPTAYAFWERYLDVFEEVRVVARVQEVAQPAANTARADGPRVSFLPIPYYLGPREFVQRYFAVRRVTRSSFDRRDAVILRVPGTIGTLVAGALWRADHPYAVEVVGDPHDVFAAGAVRSRLRPFLRYWYRRNQQRQCARAQALAYVTDVTLQRRYAPGPGAYAIGCSTVDLTDEAFVSDARPMSVTAGTFRLLLVGTLQQLYKGPDVLIRAVAANVGRGADLRLTIAGDGRHRSEMEQLARTLGVVDRVHFAGHLPGAAAVRAELDATDLFVMPSRTEGLPRALVEAMARGLPCVASDVGGIPELLAAEDLVPPGDADALAAKIAEVCADPERRARMAARNLKRARDFHADVLRARRKAFYEHVRDFTQQWSSSVAQRR